MNAIKAAKNQTLFREVNERIRNFEYAVPSAEFVCECANEDCQVTVTVSLEEYEEIRRVPSHFIVSAGSAHVFLDVERIFETHSSYWVVEKFGQAGVDAIRLDPRRRVDRAAS
jgi:hypothetical protein